MGSDTTCDSFIYFPARGNLRETSDFTHKTGGDIDQKFWPKYRLVPNTESPPNTKKEAFSAVNGPFLPAGPILPSLEIKPLQRSGQSLGYVELKDNSLVRIGATKSCLQSLSEV